MKGGAFLRVTQEDGRKGDSAGEHDQGVLLPSSRLLCDYFTAGASFLMPLSLIV